MIIILITEKEKKRNQFFYQYEIFPFPWLKVLVNVPQPRHSDSLKSLALTPSSPYRGQWGVRVSDI